MKQCRQRKDHTAVCTGPFHYEEKQDFYAKDHKYLFYRLAEFDEISSVQDMMHCIQQHRNKHIYQDQQDQNITVKIIGKKIESIIIHTIRQEKRQHKAHHIQKDEVQVFGPVFTVAFIHALSYTPAIPVFCKATAGLFQFRMRSLIQSTGESAQSHRFAALPSSCCRSADRGLG